MIICLLLLARTLAECTRCSNMIHSRRYIVHYTMLNMIGQKRSEMYMFIV
jgi:hypothetical protein